MQKNILILGFGILGGIGMGIGYAAPTPAALKWFGPHRRGLIAGLVVGGYGGAGRGHGGNRVRQPQPGHAVAEHAGGSQSIHCVISGDGVISVPFFDGK